MHVFANPARFRSIARPLTPWLFWGGLLLLLIGTVAGLFYAPANYLQGESVRIMYVHVPAAWLGMGGWTGVLIARPVQIVWRHPLACVTGLALVAPGALFTALCILTGPSWGGPNRGGKEGTKSSTH